MEKEKIPVELEQSLKKLSEHLNIFLNKTETTLAISKNRFDQVYSVLQPWNLSKYQFFDDYDETSCICDSLKTDASTTGTVDNSLLESISKTLSTAQTLLSKKSTTSKKSNETNKKSNKTTTTTTTSVKQKLTTKSKQTLATKSTISQTTDGISSHYPSCPLFNVDVTSKKLSNLSLTDAISITKVPFSLSHTIKQCNKFLQNLEADTKEIKGKHKLNFLHQLEAQNKKSCAKFEAQYSPSEIFIKYLSALNTYRIKQNDSKSELSWVYYTNVKDIETFHKNRNAIITKESWNSILIFILTKIIPILEKSELGIMEKLYIQKMLKTICNFTQSSIPRVPIFKIHHQDD